MRRTIVPILFLASVSAILYGLTPPSGLFIPSPAPSRPLPDMIKGLRSRYVRFDPALLKDLGVRFTTPGQDPGFTLNLFPDVTVDWTVTRALLRPGGWALWGQKADDAESQVVLAYREGYLAGTVKLKSKGTFAIRYAGGDFIHRVSEVDPLAPLGCGVKETGDAITASAGGDGLPPLSKLGVVPRECADSPVTRTRHFLAVGTQDFVAAAGGLFPFDGIVDSDWIATNLTFQNSRINAQFDLVHTAAVTYTETGDSYLDLNRLHRATDNYLDEVYSMKAAYGAEYVLLYVLATSPGVAGLGLMPGGSCLTNGGVDVATHELGHNLGCMHDRDNSSSPGIRPYAYGHRFVGSSGVTYRTMMAYAPGRRIEYFSNPGVSYDGMPTGVDASRPDSADNARVINEIFTDLPYTGTNQLPAVTLVSPSSGTSYFGAPSIPFEATASDPDGSIVQVEFYANGRHRGTDSTPPYQFDWNLYVPSGTLVLSASAIDDHGAHRMSCPVTIYVDIPTPTFTPSPVWTYNATPRFTPDVSPAPTWAVTPCSTRMSVESVAADGTQADRIGYSSMIDWNGRWVVFESNASNLPPPPSTTLRNIYRRDRATGALQRLSIGWNGLPGDGNSYSGVISGDGQRVAFYSEATNLVPGDTNGLRDLFIYDVPTGTVSLIGPHTILSFDSPSLSGDGRFVAYVRNITTTPPFSVDVIEVVDLSTGVRECASCAPGGILPDGICCSPFLSGGGRFVVFETWATNLLTAPYVSNRHCMLYDRTTGTHELIDIRPDGEPSHETTNSFMEPSISSDGRLVSFISSASDLVPGDTEGFRDAFVYDRQTLTLHRVSLNAQGAGANAHTYGAVLSPDGRFIFFLTSATNLLPGVDNGRQHLYRRDLATGNLVLVDQGENGTPGNYGACIYRAHSNATGELVLFDSYSTNLGPVVLHPEFYSACVPLPTPTPTVTPTWTVTISPTPSSPTPTETPFIPDEETMTFTSTPTATFTATPTATPTVTSTGTPTPLLLTLTKSVLNPLPAYDVDYPVTFTLGICNSGSVCNEPFTILDFRAFGGGDMALLFDRFEGHALGITGALGEIYNATTTGGPNIAFPFGFPASPACWSVTFVGVESALQPYERCMERENYAMMTLNAPPVFSNSVTWIMACTPLPSPTATPSPSPTPTGTPSFTPSSIASSTSTPTPSFSPTSTFYLPPSTSTPTATAGGVLLLPFPNPATGDEIAVLLPPGSSPIRAGLYTTACRRVGEWEWKDYPMGGLAVIRLRDRQGATLANGLYHLVFDVGVRRIVRKVVVLR